MSRSTDLNACLIILHILAHTFLYHDTALPRTVHMLWASNIPVCVPPRSTAPRVPCPVSRGGHPRCQRQGFIRHKLQVRKSQFLSYAV